MPSSTTFLLVSVNGGTDPQEQANTGIESNLDIQYATGVATGVPISFMSVGGDPETENDFFLLVEKEANYLLTMDKPPTVLTTSYSVNENEITRSLAM